MENSKKAWDELPEYKPVRWCKKKGWFNNFE